MKITYWISRVVEGGKPKPIIEYEDRNEAYKDLAKIKNCKYTIIPEVK